MSLETLLLPLPGDDLVVGRPSQPWLAPSCFSLCHQFDEGEVLWSLFSSGPRAASLQALIGLLRMVHVDHGRGHPDRVPVRRLTLPLASR